MIRRFYHLTKALAMLATSFGIISWYFPQVPRGLVSIVTGISGSVGQQAQQHLPITWPDAPAPSQATRSPSTSPQATATSPPVLLATNPPQPPSTWSPRQGAWTVAACTWAHQTLEEDAQLDQQTAAAGGPTPGIYATAAQHWQSLDGMARIACGEASGILDAQSCTDQASWVAVALQSHVTDMGLHPENAVWDNTWAANYRRLANLFQEVCA